MRSLLTSLMVMAVAVGVVASQAAALPTEAAFRKAAATLAENPLSPEGQAAAKTVTEFVEGSDQCMVHLAPWSMPWTGEGKEYKHAEILMAAFSAGNTLAQLDSGVNQDDPYSGLIQVFRVYRFLKSKDAAYKVPEIEKLLEVHQKGELAAYLAKAKKEAEGQ